MGSFDEQLENTNADYRELPSPRDGVEFDAKSQRDRFLGGGGKLTEAPPAVDNLVSRQSKMEQKPNPMNLLEKANELLKRSEARTWKEAMPSYHELNPDVPLSETFLGLDDKKSNTSFLICNGLDPRIVATEDGESIFRRYTQIAWAELQDQKGGRIKRVGFVRFTYDKDGKIVEILGDNGDASYREKIGGTLYNDDSWYSGQGTRGNHIIEWIGVGNASFTDKKLAEIVTDIMPKLERAAEKGVNQQFTERTVETIIANDAEMKALPDSSNPTGAGDPRLIEAATQEDLTTLNTFYQEEQKEKRLWQILLNNLKTLLFRRNKV
jgi:hypothetical protein